MRVDAQTAAGPRAGFWIFRSPPVRRVLNRLSAAVQSRQAAAALLLAALLAGMATYGALTRHSADPDTVFWLLNLDLVLLLLVGAVVGRQVARLWAERRRGAAGSRLHVRLVMIFSLLAAAPAVLMAVFSATFFYFGVQAWFNERVSTAVNESLEVAQAYLREHQQVMRADVLAMANDLSRAAPELADNPAVFGRAMQTQASLRDLSEAVVVTSGGKVIARAPLSMSLELDTPARRDFQAAASGDVVLLTQGPRDRIRALVRLDRFLDAYLYVGRLVDGAVLAHMQTAESAVNEYTLLQGRHSQLQISMTVTFMAVGLLLLLAAMWFGLVFSEQLAAPISTLMAAAERVRSGDLSVRVPLLDREDELSLLGLAFNRMTSQLEAQKAELLSANAMLDERRRFTEAVLAGTSSGILGLDAQGAITLANGRAAALLHGDQLESLVGRRLSDFIPGAGADDEPLQVDYARGPEGPRRTLLIRSTREQGGGGAVVTIDDITALVSAQRKAAWADVARRIAHEIKNPLTPIQLAAERLRRKYLPQIQEDPETFERCTETIVRQVEDIGHMVSEFSSYARMPMAARREEDLVRVCRDALVLPQQAQTDIRVEFAAEEPILPASLDRSQITQVVTNLIQNAIDSIAERRESDPAAPAGLVRVTVGRRGPNAAVTVEDNGLGLPDKIKEQILDPYVTTKKKGSGLGLAIVRKIMEDHGGDVSLEDIMDQGRKTGARAVILFPTDMVA